MCILHEGGAVQPKGNGISAEGWQGIKNNIGEADHIALPLCRSLLAFYCALARRSILHIEFFIMCSEVCLGLSPSILPFASMATLVSLKKSHCFGSGLGC